MQTLIPSPSSPSPGGKEPKFQNPNPTSSPSPSPASIRLWRPSAQRNLRNQWSKLLSHRQRWASASSDGRSHATSIVNAHLSHRYMPDMDVGVLSGMSDIKQRAQEKLARRQVGVVAQMVNASRSMRCFLKGSMNSPIVQFGSQPEDGNDTGDGGGVPVFSFLSILYFESLAQELAQMFVQELTLKRLLVLELLSINREEDSSVQTNRLSWSDELYPGEFDDLSISDLLYSKEHCQPVPPRINGWEFGNPTTGRTNNLLDREVLEVYLTAWLVEVNINIYRVDQIFTMIGEEMNVNLS
ncbi:uncharacterized protein LOC131235694 isoform X2 [Magnolia sinica]|uniref:uncharacterized protein LOC131235694 isoform X2 n=1 Tax=Magnolia sinica TaxID=86752 RepID=UPI0026592C5F|nr:uncharacterized protein LOC131235694 isoform X2 [Magnolia sinica]